MADVKDFIDNDSPLIQRFKELAPGTFRHCSNVAQLCEPIAKELGLNIDNLIVAAMLHDIGKTFNPEAFIENTVDKNMHDGLDPAISYQLISRHISDSVLKLVQHGVPLDVVRIVSEHHGNGIMKVIYGKALEKNADIVPDHYRYKSNKPSSAESCVLMICDVIESAARAMHNANKLTDCKAVIDKLIESIIVDTQIDILSLGQLRVIKKILISEIANVYHKRIDYEETDKVKAK